MLWRLPPSVRSLLVSNRRRYSSTKAIDPLRVLFCGSDDFSIPSLRALNDAKQANRKLIESIDVIHRPAKRTGRALKVTREVPIKKVATKELKLTTHEIDTFTGWTPPVSFNIIIAVSFGLFVPPRIFNDAKYGGLNVHPSLLPDLRGPAPIHHTLLKRRSKTGVTVQTLHQKNFDRGTILAQTPAPGLDVPQGAMPADLVQQLGILGSQMLVDVLNSRTFISPQEYAGWYDDSDGPIDYAEKITPAHSFVDFSTTTALDIMTHHRVLGSLWCTLENGERLTLNKIVPLNVPDTESRLPGLFESGEPGGVIARTADGHLLEIQDSTVSGGRRGLGNSHVIRVLRNFRRTNEGLVH